MSRRLGRVLDDLGRTLLQVVCGDVDRPDELGGITIYDAADEFVSPVNTLVLGVGVHEPSDIEALLVELAPYEVGGLVIRAPVPLDQRITDAVAASGIALLELTRGASWTQLAAMLRTLLAEGDVGVGESETLAGMPSGDLFALANAVAALVDAPVTIEDRNSKVVAFSGRQDEADSSRVATILGRQVPERYSRALAERGAFRQLYRSDQPVYIEPVTTEPQEVALPRVAVAVRVGDEVLGSIWAAVPAPLSAERSEALRDAAKVVALHMLRIRAGADVERRLRADLMSTALEGGPGAREAIDRLGLTDQTVVVIALAVFGSSEDRPSVGLDANLATERQHLADALAMHLTAMHPRSAAALIGDTAYAMLPVPRGGLDADQRAVRIAGDFLERTGKRLNASIGIGPAAEDAATLAQSRISADRALRVLRASSRPGRVVRLADVHVEALLLELRDQMAAHGDVPTGPVARLIEYDDLHGGKLVDTLRAWLNAFGDVIAASASVFVHPNTFRYRLRRLAVVAQIDLADPEARFAAMLQLRVMSPTL